MIYSKKVVGSSVEVDVDTFRDLMQRKGAGLIVTAKSGFFTKTFKYQLFYDDFIFLVSTGSSIVIPKEFTLVVAEKIFNPIFTVS
jgi:hypothetical protein